MPSTSLLDAACFPFHSYSSLLGVGLMGFLHRRHCCLLPCRRCCFPPCGGCLPCLGDSGTFPDCMALFCCGASLSCLEKHHPATYPPPYPATARKCKHALKESFAFHFLFFLFSLFFSFSFFAHHSLDL